jgi:hypothetical protein
MEKIVVDGVEYLLDSLSVQAKEHLASVQFVDLELMRMNAQMAALQTARGAYISALKEVLPAEGAVNKA